MDRRTRFGSIVQGMTAVAACPVTVKMRAGVHNRNWNAHKLLPQLREWGVAMTTVSGTGIHTHLETHTHTHTHTQVHGRSKEQRYTKVADWDYISRCSQAAHPMPVFGCGDVLSFKDHDLHSQGQAGIMIARCVCTCVRDGEKCVCVSIQGCLDQAVDFHRNQRKKVSLNTCYSQCNTV